jgi:hypothetical protein
MGWRWSGLEKEFMLDHAKLSLEGHRTPLKIPNDDGTPDSP